MSFQVTDNTIVKILVRRGLESERQSTVLTEGELGYSIDTRRVFVGDGVSLGGTVVGNKYFGSTGFANDFTPFAQPGDTIFENNILKALGETGVWSSIHPVYFQESANLNIPSIEYSTNNRVRVSPFVLGEGFMLAYSDSPTPTNVNFTLQKKFANINFDSRYLSLSGAFKSFYFGDISSKTVTNNLQATVNVDNSLFVASTDASPKQIKILAKDSNSNSSIEATNGNLDIVGNASLNLYGTQGNKNLQLLNTNKVILSASRNGYYGMPDIDVYGAAVFRDDVYIQDNTTIFGNLSVYGDVSYFDTNVTTTSALSVINSNSNIDTFVVKQFGSAVDQNVMRIEGAAVTPYFIIKDATSGPVIGINTLPANGSQTGFIVNTNTYVWGGEIVLGPSTQNITLSTAGTIGLTASNIIFQGTGVCRNIGDFNVTGNVYADSDVVAYYTSDKSLKTNLQPIDSYNIIKNIDAYKFKWSDNSDKHLKGKEDFGIIAQELEKILPELVHERENGLKAVDYIKLVPILLDAVKKLIEGK